jgi:hypothetical protein
MNQFADKAGQLWPKIRDGPILRFAVIVVALLVLFSLS